MLTTTQGWHPPTQFAFFCIRYLMVTGKENQPMIVANRNSVTGPATQIFDIAFLAWRPIPEKLDQDLGLKGTVLSLEEAYKFWSLVWRAILVEDLDPMLPWYHLTKR